MNTQHTPNTRSDTQYITQPDTTQIIQNNSSNPTDATAKQKTTKSLDTQPSNLK